MRIRAVVARLPHKQEVEGLNPPSATRLFMFCPIIFVVGGRVEYHKFWLCHLHNERIAQSG